MRPAWRLAIKSVYTRRSRTALLIATVALSAALIAAVSCALASLNKALEGNMSATVGSADIRVKAPGSGKNFDSAVQATVLSWPEVDLAVGRLTETLSLRFSAPAWLETAAVPGEFRRQRRTFIIRTVANGVVPEFENRFRPLTLLEGRWPADDDEVVLDTAAVRGLSAASLSADRKSFLPVPGGAAISTAEQEPEKPDPSDKRPTLVTSADEAITLNRDAKVKVGDRIEAVRLLRKPIKLKVVGIVAQPPLGGRWQCYMTLAGLAKATDQAGKVAQIDIVLKPGYDPEAAVVKYKNALPAGLILQTTEKVTSGLRNNMKSNQLGLILAGTMAFLAASFIITTAMTTSVTERQRELAMLRCVGAARSQLAVMQLFTGALIGLVGALIGVPLGVFFAYLLSAVFRTELPGGLAISGLGMVLAPAGSLLAGIAGAAIPAWQASRVSPLEALSVRARAARPVWVWRLLAIGLACLALHMAIVTLPNDGQVVFWGYATVGLPVMFTGYFLLGVPTVLLIATLFGGAVSKLLRLPPTLLVRTVRATPYRHGFTAGAMMTGLALMVALWTQGTAVLRDWLGKLDFPDAFVSGLNLTKENQDTLDAMPFVSATCAITLHPVQPVQSLGVTALQRYSTTFIAFDPAPFFAMTRLKWIQGDPATAQRRLEEGGAVLVAREFLTARGLGIGDTFRCSDQGKEFDFEIVGVVTSPGLEIVSQFFNIGQDYTDQSLHAVFGSRRDLKEKFGSDSIHLIQIGLKPEGTPGAVSDDQAITTIKRQLFSAGILDAGSGRKVKEDIATIVKGGLLVASTIAVFSMLVACFGVANLIIAGIAARQFEFGVLRSVGASRALVSRLVLGEAVIIALAACILGTLMGFQGAYSGRRLNALLIGLELTFRPPWRAIAASWAVVMLMTVGAAAPAVWSLSRKKVRDLVGAMKG